MLLLNERFPKDMHRYKRGEDHVEILVHEILEAFESVTWFTYRRGFEVPLIKSTYTSDAGWGCMLRTGQMLLFQALSKHVLGPNF